MSNFDNELQNKIDVTSELLKMGIKIVAPQVLQKMSIKSLSEADFVNKNAKNDRPKKVASDELPWRVDSKKESTKKKRKKTSSLSTPTTSSPPLPNNNMFNLTESQYENELINDIFQESQTFTSNQSNNNKKNVQNSNQPREYCSSSQSSSQIKNLNQQYQKINVTDHQSQSFKIRVKTSPLTPNPCHFD